MCYLCLHVSDVVAASSRATALSRAAQMILHHASVHLVIVSV